MSRLMVGFHILVAFVFFAGIGVEAYQLGRCANMMSEFQVDFDSTINQIEDEQLRWFCGNMTGILRCLDEIIKEDTGLTAREFAEAFKDNPIGKSLRLMLNVDDVIHDICTPGSQLQEDFLENAECFINFVPYKLKECEDQSKEAFETFRNLQGETNERLPRDDRFCMHFGYQLGCLGAAVHEECGDKALATYKEVVTKIGFLKSGVCSSDIVETIKTSFVESLDELESRKSLYRVILDLKKRRK